VLGVLGFNLHFPEFLRIMRAAVGAELMVGEPLDLADLAAVAMVVLPT
jgi:hypothetical protein